MNRISDERMTAEIEGDFVVFLIGIRINKPWKIHKWWPVAMAMPGMIKELEENPDLGMLGHISAARSTVQYWRSFDHLDAYARSRDSEHLPRGDVGIWHETYFVQAGAYESIYSGMPPYGLGAASRLVPAVGAKESARQRIEGNL